jgi:N-methylhydantoinase A
MRVATDIGGTFTDLVSFVYDNQNNINEIVVVKTHTTPPNFEQGIINAIDKSSIDTKQIDFFAHGTTVVINAITERKGAKTALITTRGFRDVLEIARCNRPDLFNFNFKKPEPFIPRYLRLEVEERITYKGEIHQNLNESDLKKAVEQLKAEGVEALAISFLHAYKNPVHELKAIELIKGWWPSLEIVASHTVSREWREYERTNTAALSAFVKPATKKYIDNLTQQLTARGLKKPPFIMQSNGGIATAERVKENPISIIESGPAGGILGCASLGKLINEPNLIVLDIGGTTAKCSLIENFQVKITTHYHVEKSKTNPGYPLQTPVIDIVEIGNGGGSIAWVDAGNKMHVGPQSASSVPGPAAYGKGGINVTTTDANLVLGRIHPNYFLGGEAKPNWEKIDEAFAPLQEKLHLTKPEVARGIVRIANANMVNALKLISINKGYDPRDFVLVTIGGGGAMHAVELAAELQIKKVIVPAYAGVFSALGMLLTDLRRDVLRTNVFAFIENNASSFIDLYSEMEQEILQQFTQDGYAQDAVHFDWYADLRYSGQEHVVKVKISKSSFSKSDIAAVIADFNAAHKKQYTYDLPTSVEIVNQHIVATIPVGDSQLPKQNQARNAMKTEECEVDFDYLGVHMAKLYNRDELPFGQKIEGPALIADNSTSTLLPPGHDAEKDAYGNIIITKNK